MDKVIEEFDKITISKEIPPIDYQKIFIVAQEEVRKFEDETRKAQEEYKLKI